MWERIKAAVLWSWRLVSMPAATLSLGFLTLGGFVGGVIFWGAFNTALEITNTEDFCISCHEMEANVYEELTRTVHFSNRSGVRASCPDCHVPHEWTDKIARKMQASKEVWGKIFGTISTRQKFLEKRLELAQHEWARLKANDSLECRNCHSSVAMDLSKQAPRAAEIHTRFLLSGAATCIDCHKGIAHELPNMEGIDPGWQVPPELQGEELPQTSVFDRLGRFAGSPHGSAEPWSIPVSPRAKSGPPRKPAVMEAVPDVGSAGFLAAVSAAGASRH